jgi:hypothetical protein
MIPAEGSIKPARGRLYRYELTKVKDLYGRAVHFDGAGHSSQGSELDLGDFGVGPSELRHQGRLCNVVRWIEVIDCL